jgi:hypothetical protein
VKKLMTTHTDPTVSLAPAHRQRLSAASASVGTTRDALAKLDRHEDRASQLLKAVGTLDDA